MVLIDVADRYQIDAGRAPIQLIDDEEIDKQLLDVDGAVQLIVGIERDASMLELDFGIENDIGGDCVGLQQHEPMGIEAVLPLAVCGRVLKRAKFDFAISPDAEAGNGRVEPAKNGLAAWRWWDDTRP